MSHDLLLPGTIPGLLRKGSPVVTVEGHRGVVMDIAPHHDRTGWVRVSCCGLTRTLPVLSLDLRDPTGAIHAALWALPRFDAIPANQLAESSILDRIMLINVLTGRTFCIASLRDLCLRLAEGASDG